MIRCKKCMYVSFNFAPHFHNGHCFYVRIIEKYKRIFPMFFFLHLFYNNVAWSTLTGEWFAYCKTIGRSVAKVIKEKVINEMSDMLMEKDYKINNIVNTSG